MKRLLVKISKVVPLGCLVLISCKQEVPTLKSPTKFIPHFHTNLEVKNEVTLITLKKGINIDSSVICVKDIYRDIGYSKKFRFTLCDSFRVGYDYDIIIDLDKKYTYKFRDCL